MYRVYLMLRDGRTLDVSGHSEQTALEYASAYIYSHHLDVQQWTMQDLDGGDWYPLRAFDGTNLRMY